MNPKAGGSCSPQLETFSVSQTQNFESQGDGYYLSSKDDTVILGVFWTAGGKSSHHSGNGGWWPLLPYSLVNLRSISIDFIMWSFSMAILSEFSMSLLWSYICSLLQWDCVSLDRIHVIPVERLVYYYRLMDLVQHNVIIYFDSMSCLQAIEGEETDNPLICQITNPLWALSGTRARFCWMPSQSGIEGNEIVDQLANETLDHNIDPLTSVHFADLKPLVNACIQQEIQIK